MNLSIFAITHFNPGHVLSVVDLETRAHVVDIDLSPCIAPHGLQIGPDGLLYITCENMATDPPDAL